ncbi:glycosyltransferase family 9 protein [Aeromonas cavernicola]|uniref:ADP-heptose--LPS heptosyltransferase I n=1 Tax=Aeromonas cavernicola TaxID=1006623 RepID=A0A2H9U454_9GAMM|nr:glycosyltransferase family 9 protein [Aeromonas cavernicola]PJG58759.1 ADP-heptose--LPS heptosyltransferase I [Aeromonas cavernicola]
MPLFQTPPSSICILRLSAIGDCCHALALVRVIQRAWPQTRITWVTGSIEATLFADLPGVEIIPFDKRKGWRGYRDLWRTLKGRKFDALLHLQAAMRASIATLGIQAKVKLGFDRERANDGQWLFTNHKVPSPTSPHVLDGFLAFAKELGIDDLTPDWQLPISAEHRAWAQQKIGGKPTLLICAAASKAFKNWTAAGYAALADHAASKGFQVYLCGGPAQLERDLAAEIQQRSQHKPVDLVGQTNLKQLLALIDEASLVLAPDTGPTHMATLVGTPVIGLYAHHNPARTGPYLCREYVVSIYQTLIEQQTGQSVAELGWRTRLKDPAAMASITDAQVIATFDRLCTDLQLCD